MARIALRTLLAAAGLGALPAFALNGNCTFQAKGLSLAFGTLNPANAVNATASITPATLNANMVGSCKDPPSMSIDADNGQHFSGSRRMTNGTDFIPYSLSGLPITLSPVPGNNKYVQFIFSATILRTDYQNVSAGDYADTITLTVNP